MIRKFEQRRRTLGLLARRESMYSQSLIDSHSRLEQVFSEARETLHEKLNTYRDAENALGQMLAGDSTLDLTRLSGLKAFIAESEEALEEAEQAFSNARDEYEGSLAELKSSQLNQRLFDKTIAGLNREISTLGEREAERTVTELWLSAKWQKG